MNRTHSHKISICTAFQPDDRAFQAGYKLASQLRSAIDLAGETATEAFEISGVASLADCGRDYRVAYFGSRQTVFVFGDVEPEADIAALVAFARNYGKRTGIWNTSFEATGVPDEALLALGATSIIALERDQERLQ